MRGVRIAITVGGLVLAAITLPSNLGSVGPSIQAWRRLLADVGGAPLQNLVFYAAVATMLIGFFGPAPYRHLREQLASRRSDSHPEDPTTAAVVPPSLASEANEPAADDRPVFTSRILTEGTHFWIEITNQGPREIPDPPLLLNLLVPKSWKLTAGGGKWAPSREDLLDPATGRPVRAALWSFKDDDPPRPRVSQTYEFQLDEDLPHGAHPISLRLFGYQRFDGVFVAVPGPEGEDRVTSTLNDLVVAEADLVARAKHGGEPPPRGFPAIADDKPIENLQALLRRGLDLVNTIPVGEDLPADSVLPGSVDAWEREVRELLKAHLPEWAFYFEKPRANTTDRLVLKNSSDQLRQRMHPRLQRLSQVIQHVKLGSVAEAD